MRIFVAVAECVSLLALCACADPPPPKAAKPLEVVEAPDVPTYCASKAKPCVPTPEFVEALCRKSYPSVAPYLFQKHTPFVREYVKCKSCETQASVRGHDNTPLVFAEELLLLRVITEAPEKAKQAPKETHELMRWDGTCVTLAKRDVVPYLPGNPEAAPIVFDDFDTTMRTALLRDKKIEATQAACEAYCKDPKSADCKRSRKALSDQVIKAIRLGQRLPMPRDRPSFGAAHE
jgi:hypothetical protein